MRSMRWVDLDDASIFQASCRRREIARHHGINTILFIRGGCGKCVGTQEDCLLLAEDDDAGLALDLVFENHLFVLAIFVRSNVLVL